MMLIFVTVQLIDGYTIEGPQLEENPPPHNPSFTTNYQFYSDFSKKIQKKEVQEPLLEEKEGSLFLPKLITQYCLPCRQEGP